MLELKAVVIFWQVARVPIYVVQSPLVQLSTPSKKHPLRNEVHVVFDVYVNELYNLAYEHDVIAEHEAFVFFSEAN